MWLDDCRIPFVGTDTTNAGKRTCNIFETEYQSGGNGSPDYETNPKGRFTPNLLVCDNMLNDGNIGGGGKHSGAIKRRRKGFMIGDVDGYSNSPDNYGDKGTNSRYYDLDKWFDKVIDEIQ